MRRVALPAVLALLTLLAGCSFAVAPGSSPSTTVGPEGEPVTDAPDETDGATTDPTPTDTDTPDGTPTETPTERADPESDRLGWENGYWYDDPVAVDGSDGLNESEQSAVVSRAMARVERLRGLEFQRSVPVTVVSRANFSAPNASRPTGDALRTFDNAKFEALFLVGEDEGSLSVQDATRNQTVGGFYSPQRGSIVVVSDAADPRLDSVNTLSHELVHALQDQHFNLSDTDAATRDAYNGRNGLIEGDATVVQNAYAANCGDRWACLGGSAADRNGSAAQPPPHFGIYFMEYFPYEAGPDLIEHLRGETGDWTAVDEAFADPPSSSRAVIDPSLYGSFEPRNVSLDADARDGWERVRPPGRVDYGVTGPSAIASAFAYTLYDSYNGDGAIRPADFLNVDSGITVNRTDPFDYGLPFLQGWTGERLHVYERGDESAYVWRLTWETPADAERFAGAYRELLRHWGANRVETSTWQIAADSPFEDALRLEVDGDTVTVANAPAAADLPAVYAGAR